MNITEKIIPSCEKNIKLNRKVNSLMKKTDKIKAVIMAGGKGIRARPFTDYFPKAMIPIFEKPLVSYVVQYLQSFPFVAEIIVVCDLKGLGGQIKHYLEGENTKIKFVQDSSSGTGGDILHISKYIKEDEFILWFVDNLAAIDIEEMLQYFKSKKSLACIATRQYRKEETGFAKVQDGVISEFIEKPIIQLQNSECLGIYIVSKKILDIIKSKSKTKKDLNLSFDVFEELSKKKAISAYDIKKTLWLDAESPVKIERDVEIARKIIKQMSST
jgi:mannose-1-phosphate guanylyltransferase